jgi:hypothetical protein
MHRRRSRLVAGYLAVTCAIAAAPAAAGTGKPTVQPQLLDDAQIQPLSATVGGADVVPTTRTVPHWFGSTLDPHDDLNRWGFTVPAPGC